MNTAVATRMSAEEFLRLHGGESHVELVRGEVVREEPMPGSRHGKIGQKLARKIGNFVEEHDLGTDFNNDTFIRTRPDSIRGMDYAYISFKRLPKGQEVDDGPVPVSPELIVEVLSPWNRKSDMERKIDEYHAIGVDVVVVVDPELEIASVFRPNEIPQRFHNGDSFELQDVLPGFSMPLKTFFS
jgi:Uma2 family endonuclease